MKLKLLFALLILALWCNAQTTKTITISEKKIGTITCSYKMRVDLDKEDTVPYISLLFQNASYSTITDIKGIFLYIRRDSSTVFNFTKKLNMAFAEMANPSDRDWNEKEFALHLSKDLKTLWICEAPGEGNGWTWATKNQVAKILEWFKSIGFVSK